MAKDVPDLAGLAPRIQKQHTGCVLSHAGSFDDFSAFYNSLNNEQKKKVADHIREKMSH